VENLIKAFNIQNHYGDDSIFAEEDSTGGVFEIINGQILASATLLVHG